MTGRKTRHDQGAPCLDQLMESLDSYLPSSLGPNSNQLALVIVSRAAVGGEITLERATRDTRPLVVAEATIPTRRN
jgi:hypothetical protein